MSSFYPKPETDVLNADPVAHYIYLGAIVGGRSDAADGRTAVAYQAVDENLYIQEDSDSGRYIISFSHGLQRIYLSEGSAAQVDPSNPDPPPVVPVITELAGKPLSNKVGRPYWNVGAEGILPGVTYNVLVAWLGGRAEAYLREFINDDDEDDAFVVGSITLAVVGDGLGDPVIAQLWASDILFYNGGSSSVSSSSSSSSKKSSSPPSDSTPVDSTPSEPGTSKDTAIVPASWSKHGYTAVFVMEHPEVVFRDTFKDLLVSQPIQRFRIDPRFIEVCEKDSIRAIGITSSEPIPLGVHIGKGWLTIKRDPGVATIAQVEITATRNGFADMRFPDRDREQFDANEATLNSAYPAKDL